MRTILTVTRIQEIAPDVSPNIRTTDQEKGKTVQKNVIQTHEDKYKNEDNRRRSIY